MILLNKPLLDDMASDLVSRPLVRASNLLTTPRLVEEVPAGVMAPLESIPRDSLPTSPNPPERY